MSRPPPPETLNALRAVIEAEQRPFGPRAQAMAEAIRARHPGAVRALIFYGSGLRGEDAGGRMLDFYVIVDSYRAVHGRGLKRLASFLAPPSVHYAETEGPDGELLRSKYAVVSASAFHRRARGAALESMLWARFAQPALISAETAGERARLVETLARAAAHLAAETAPLMGGAAGALDLWIRALTESYRTELRPENAPERARLIVQQYPDRYTRLAKALYPAAGADSIRLPAPSAFARAAARARWALRRVAGKPMGAFRVLKGVFTFDNGLDYILEKIEGHSGVRLEVGPRARRHPLLYSPVLAWRLFRRGAFR